MTKIIKYQIFVWLLLAIPAFAGQNTFLYRVIYDQNGIIRGGWERLIEHIKLGASAGYNGIATCEHSFGMLEKQKPEFFAHFNQVKAEAEAHNMKLFPWHFYQAHAAWENWNLAESFPVKGTKFLVKDGKATGAGDHDTEFKNGDFEEYNGVTPTAWQYSYLPSSHCGVDLNTRRFGKASFRVRNAPKFSRIVQYVKLKPFRAYRISGWFKTSKIKSWGEVQFAAEGNNGGLLHRRERPFGVPIIDPDGNRGGHWTTLSNNQGWRESVIDFNSLTSTSAKLSLWFTYRTEQGGDIWVDNIELREVGLYEALRGPTRPIKVTNATGTVTYSEGKDYVVHPQGEKFGFENYNHEGHLEIPRGSAIVEGQELRADWYQYANVETIIPESDYCLPKTWSTYTDNVKRMDDLFGNADAMWCNIDEWRVAGWNDKCEAFQFRHAGEYMAKSWKGIESLLRSTGNGCRTVFVWNDMLDPYHNAWKGPYGMVFGNTCYGSYKGLSHEAIIGNWNVNARAQSLRFYGGKDPEYPNVKCRQIVNSMYPSCAVTWDKLLDSAEVDGVDNVVGISWVTWYNEYEQIIPVANAYKSLGRWGNNPFPIKTCDPIPLSGINGKQENVIQNLSANMHFAVEGRAFDIRYRLSQSADVEIKAFDLHGRQVQLITSGKQNAGLNSAKWSTSTVPAGVYFLRLSIDGTSQQIFKQIVF